MITILCYLIRDDICIYIYVYITCQEGESFMSNFLMILRHMWISNGSYFE